MANAQTRQDNKIDWHEVTIDGINVKITWADNNPDDNKWEYTITALERYADNGLPWIYRIIETPPKYYQGTAITVNQKILCQFAYLCSR